MTTDRWGAASGLGAILTGAAAVAFDCGPLSASDPVGKMVAYYTDNAGALRAQVLLFAVGAGFFLWFLGSLRSLLRRAEGGSGRLSSVAMGAGVASTVVTLVALSFQLGLASSARDAGQPALIGIMDALFVVANLPLAVMLVSVAVLTLRTAVLPAWLGWLSLVAAVTQLIPVGGIVLDEGPLAADGWLSAYLPYPLYALWLAGAVVATIRRVGTLPTGHAGLGGMPAGSAVTSPR
ncbi:MAG: hypothetical protein ACYDAN_16465 [Candidatus Limnocylindrales bacterium]